MRTFELKDRGNEHEFFVYGLDGRAEVSYFRNKEFNLSIEQINDSLRYFKFQPLTEEEAIYIILHFKEIQL